MAQLRIHSAYYIKLVEAKGFTVRENFYRHISEGIPILGFYYNGESLVPDAKTENEFRARTESRIVELFTIISSKRGNAEVNELMQQLERLDQSCRGWLNTYGSYPQWLNSLLYQL
jgi:hypothetical protein